MYRGSDLTKDILKITFHARRVGISAMSSSKSINSIVVGRVA